MELKIYFKLRDKNSAHENICYEVLEIYMYFCCRCSPKVTKIMSKKYTSRQTYLKVENNKHKENILKEKSKKNNNFPSMEKETDNRNINDKYKRQWNKIHKMLKKRTVIQEM